MGQLGGVGVSGRAPGHWCFLVILSQRGFSADWALHVRWSSAVSAETTGFTWEVWIQVAIPPTLTAVGVVSNTKQGLSTVARGFALGATLQTRSLQLGKGRLPLGCQACRLLQVETTLLFGLFGELLAYCIDHGY